MKRHATTILVLVIAAISVRCQFGFDCDTNAVLKRLAGPGATDCGTADGWEETFLEDIDAARACIGTALDRGLPFYAAVSPASSDGGTIIGYAGDGETLHRMRYDYVIAIGCVGGDEESMQQERCARLVDLGEECGTSGDDLCFDCEGAASIEGPCS